MDVPKETLGKHKALKGCRIGFLMFAGGFFRGRAVRRILGFFGAILAFLAGLLVLVAMASSGAAASLGMGFQVVLALGAFLGAWWIHNASKALLFPRARLTTGGFLTAAVGVLLILVGRGTEGFLALGGGIVALVATVV